MEQSAAATTTTMAASNYSFVVLAPARLPGVLAMPGPEAAVAPLEESRCRGSPDSSFVAADLAGFACCKVKKWPVAEPESFGECSAELAIVLATVA